MTETIGNIVLVALVIVGLWRALVIRRRLNAEVVALSYMEETHMAKTTRRRESRKNPPLTIPPIIAGLVKLTAPDHEHIPYEIVDAYAAMPALFRTILHAPDNFYGVINDISGLTAARAKADKDPGLATAEYAFDDKRRDDMARCVAILDTVHEDLLTELTTPITSAAFYAGIAYAAYALTQNGGAR